LGTAEENKKAKPTWVWPYPIPVCGIERQPSSLRIRMAVIIRSGPWDRGRFLQISYSRNYRTARESVNAKKCARR